MMNTIFDNEIRRKAQDTEPSDDKMLSKPGTIESAVALVHKVMHRKLPQWNGATIYDLIQGLSDEAQETFKNCQACKKMTRCLWISEKNWKWQVC